MPTTATGVALINSTVDSTAIGSTTPSTGHFTDVQSQTLELSSGGTTPTVSSGDNSTSIITSAWAKLGFAISLAATGYVKFPSWMGGLVLQWGSANSASSSQNVNFPYTSWTNVWTVICQAKNYGPNAGRASTYLDGVSTSSFTQTSAGSTNSIFWFAVGS